MPLMPSLLVGASLPSDYSGMAYGRGRIHDGSRSISQMTSAVRSGTRRSSWSCALDMFASMNENVYDCDTWPAFGHGLALRIAS